MVVYMLMLRLTLHRTVRKGNEIQVFGPCRFLLIACLLIALYDQCKLLAPAPRPHQLLKLPRKGAEDVVALGEWVAGGPLVGQFSMICTSRYI